MDKGRFRNDRFKANNNADFKDFEEYTENKNKGGNRFKSKIKDSGFELFETKCAKCGKDCDVPFLPSSNKPVYCRSCFRKTSPEESGRSGGRRDRFDKNEKSDRFESRERNDTSSNKSSKEQNLEKINAKLDKIMKALKIN